MTNNLLRHNLDGGKLFSNVNTDQNESGWKSILIVIAHEIESR
jgi:hypothetical protein